MRSSSDGSSIGRSSLAAILEVMGDATVEYYQRRADEYDSTSWDHPNGDPRVTEQVHALLSSLPAVDTLEIGCGTGYLSRWLPGHLTLMDTSRSMLALA